MTYSREQWAELTPEQRGPCDEWPYGRDGRGYGYVLVDGKQRIATRWWWEEEVGLIPSGLEVCHHCDNPACMRIAHLFLATHAENMADKVAKGRHRHGHENQTCCKRGHEFTPENTRLVLIRGSWSRVCRSCRRDRGRKYRAQRRAAGGVT